MTKIVLTTDEPTVAILLPVRFLPQLVALLAAAATPAAKPCVETTGEPAGPGVAKALPSNVHALPARKVG